MRAVLSGGGDDVAPVGAERGRENGPSCWSGPPTGWLVAASQMRAVPSSEAVTTWRPSGLKAAAQRPSSCWRRADRPAGGGVPDACGLVGGRGDDAAPVGTESRRADLVLHAREARRRLARAASQTRAVLSLEAVTTRRPSELKAAALTYA